MSGIIGKAMAGLGQGMAQVGLIELQNQAALRREKKLEELRAQHRKGEIDEQNRVTSERDATLHGYRKEEAAHAAGLQASRPVGRDVRVTELAGKIARGEASEAESKEYSMLSPDQQKSIDEKVHEMPVSQQLAYLSFLSASGKYSKAYEDWYESLKEIHQNPSPMERQMGVAIGSGAENPFRTYRESMIKYAQEAIAAGIDPDAVKKELKKLGIDPP